MKSSVFAAVLIVAFLAGAGIVWLIAGNPQQAVTQISPTVSTPGDRDADGIGDEFDYCPYDPAC